MTASIHLIRIDDREARERAIKAFLDVRAEWLGFPGNVYGVSSDHIEALKKSGIPFQDASTRNGNGQATLQS